VIRAKENARMVGFQRRDRLKKNLEPIALGRFMGVAQRKRRGARTLPDEGSGGCSRPEEAHEGRGETRLVATLTTPRKDICKREGTTKWAKSDPPETINSWTKGGGEVREK